MARIDDLRQIGAPVEDPIRTAAFIDGLILTRRQKASALREYLRDVGQPVTDAVRAAATTYADAL